MIELLDIVDEENVEKPSLGLILGWPILFSIAFNFSTLNELSVLFSLSLTCNWYLTFFSLSISPSEWSEVLSSFSLFLCFLSSLSFPPSLLTFLDLFTLTLSGFLLFSTLWSWTTLDSIISLSLLFSPGSVFKFCSINANKWHVDFVVSSNDLDSIVPFEIIITFSLCINSLISYRLLLRKSELRMESGPKWTHFTFYG
jgi:hypothetical protein